MSSSSSQAKIPSVSYDSGGLYGTAVSGYNNTFQPTDFQRQSIQQTQDGITAYLNQLINPTYDSAVFQAQTQQRNRLANQAFENNVLNPLASRGLTRGSNVNQLAGQFASSLADAEVDAMAAEDNRVGNILSQLSAYYQIPYQMMTGMQGIAQRTQAGVQQAKAAAGSNKDQMLSGLGSAGGAALGAYFGGPVGMSLGSALGGQLGGALSDKRLKEHVRHLGKPAGYDVYLFDYIQGPKHQVGVMAQDILDKSPEAVGLTPDGYYCVYYDMLPQEVTDFINTQKEALEGENHE